MTFPPESGNEFIFESLVDISGAELPSVECCSLSGTFYSMLAHYDRGFGTPRDFNCEFGNEGMFDWAYSQSEWLRFASIAKDLYSGVYWNDVVKRFEPSAKVNDFDESVSVSMFEFISQLPIECGPGFIEGSSSSSSTSSSSTSSSSSVSSLSSSSVSSSSSSESSSSVSSSSSRSNSSSQSSSNSSVSNSSIQSSSSSSSSSSSNITNSSSSSSVAGLIGSSSSSANCPTCALTSWSNVDASNELNSSFNRPWASPGTTIEINNPSDNGLVNVYEIQVSLLTGTVNDSRAAFVYYYNESEVNSLLSTYGYDYIDICYEFDLFINGYWVTVSASGCTTLHDGVSANYYDGEPVVVFAQDISPNACQELVSAMRFRIAFNVGGAGSGPSGDFGAPLDIGWAGFTACTGTDLEVIGE